MKLLLDYLTNDIYGLSGVSSLVPSLESSDEAAILRDTCQSIIRFSSFFISAREAHDGLGAIGF